MSNSFFTIPLTCCLTTMPFLYYGPGYLAPNRWAAAPLTGARSRADSSPTPCALRLLGFPVLVPECGILRSAHRQQNLNPTVMTSATTRKPAVFPRADVTKAIYLLWSASCLLSLCFFLLCVTPRSRVVPLRYYTTATFLKKWALVFLWIPAAFVILWHRTLSYTSLCGDYSDILFPLSRF